MKLRISGLLAVAAVLTVVSLSPGAALPRKL